MSKKVQFGKNTIDYIPNVSKIFEFEQVPSEQLNDMNIKIRRSDDDLPLFKFKFKVDMTEGDEIEPSNKYVYSEENPAGLLNFVGSEDLELVLTSFKGKIFNGKIRNIPVTNPERPNNSPEENLRGTSSTVEGEIPVKVFIDTDFIPRIDFSNPNDTYDGVIPGITIQSVVPADNQEDIRKKAFPERVGEIKKITMIDNTKFYGIKISGDLIEGNDLTEESYTIRQAEYKTIITDKSKILEGELDYEILNKEGNKIAFFHFVPVTSLEQSQTQTGTELTIIGYTELPEDREGELSIKVESKVEGEDKVEIDLILKKETTEINIKELIQNLINNNESRKLFSDKVVTDFSDKRDFKMKVQSTYDSVSEINVTLIADPAAGEGATEGAGDAAADPSADPAAALEEQKKQAAEAGYAMVSPQIFKVPKKVFVHQKKLDDEKIIYVNTEIVDESCDIFSFEVVEGDVRVDDVLMVSKEDRDINFESDKIVKYRLKRGNEMIAEELIKLKCKKKEKSQIFYNYFLIKKRDLEVDTSVDLSIKDIFDYIEGTSDPFFGDLRNRAELKKSKYKDEIRNLSNFDKPANIDTIYTELSDKYDIEDLNKQIIEYQTPDNLTMFNAIIQHIARDFNIKSNYLIVNFVKKVINDSDLINKGKQNLLSLYYSGYNFPYAIFSRYSKFKKDILEILMKNTGKNITTEFTGEKNIGQDNFIKDYKITFLEQVVNKGDFFTAQYYLESSEVKVNESIYLGKPDTTLLHLLYHNFVNQIRLMIELSGDNIKINNLLVGDFEITEFVARLNDDEKKKMEEYFERNELELYTYFFSKFMNKLIEVHCNNINIGKGKRLLTSFPSDENFSIKEILVDGEVESYIYKKIKAQNPIEITDECIEKDEKLGPNYEEIDPFIIIKKFFNDINKGKQKKEILLETPSEWGKFFSLLPINIGFYHNYRWVFDEKVNVKPLSQIKINKQIENIPDLFLNQEDEFDYFGLVYHNNKGKFEYISRQSEMKTIVEDVFNFERKAREEFDFSQISADGGNQKASRSDDKISKNIYILVKKKGEGEGEGEGEGKLELLPLFLRVLQDKKKKFIPIIQPSDILNNPAYSPAVNDNTDRINPAYDGEFINENPTYDTAIAVPAGGNTNGENPAYAGADGANTTGATVPTSSSDYAQPDDAILRQTVQNSAYYDMGSDTCSRVSFSESFSQESNSTLGENQNPEFNKMLTSLESERDEYNKQFGTAMEGFEGLVSPCSAPSHSDIQADNKVFIDDNKVVETCNLKNHLGGFKIGLDGILNQRFYSTKKDNVKEKYKQKHREIVEINNILIKDTKRLNNLKKCFGDLDEDKLKNLRFYSLIYRNKKNEWEYLTTLKEISQISQQIVSDVVNQSNRKKKSDVKKNIYCLVQVQVEDKEDLFFVIPFFIRHKALSGTTYNLIFEKIPNLHTEFTGLPESTNLGVSTPSSQGVADDFAREKSTRNPTYDRKDFNGLPEEFVNELFKGQEVPPSNALRRNTARQENETQSNASETSDGTSITPGRTSATQNGTSATPGNTAEQGSASAEQGRASAEQGRASAQGSNSAPPSNVSRQGNTSAIQGSNSESPPPKTIKPPDGCVKGFLRQIRVGDQLTGNIVDIKTEPNNWSWVIVEDLIKTSANKTTYCGDCLLYIEPTKDKGHILTPLPGGWRFVKVTGNLGSVGQQISFSVNLYPGQASTASNTAQSGADGESLSILTPSARAQYNKEGKLKQEKIRYLAQIIFKVENISIPRGLKINYFENKYKLESKFSCYLSDKWQKERSFFSRKVKKRIVLDKKLFWEDSQTQTPPDKKSIYSANHYQKLKNKKGLEFNENEGERIGFIVDSSRNFGVGTNGIMRACTNHVIIYQVTGEKTPKGLEENLIPGINKFDDFINKEGYNDIESWKIKIDHHFMFFNPDNTCSQDTKFGKYILPTISGGGTKKRTRQMPPHESKNRWTTKKRKNNSNIRSKKINLSNNKRSKKLNKIREN